MAYLTHCSLQFYKKKQWETSIRAVPKKVTFCLFFTFHHTYISPQERKFHVALAIEFPDHVLAFLSNDLVIQVTSVFPSFTLLI